MLMHILFMKSMWCKPVQQQNVSVHEKFLTRKYIVAIISDSYKRSVLCHDKSWHRGRLVKLGTGGMGGWNL